MRRYPGFLRAAASEADPKSHFSRRCWLSFERNSAKIREICFALNNVQVKGFDLAPLVNKDLARRIRPASQKFSAASIMRRDLTALCRIVAFQDAQVGFSLGSGILCRFPGRIFLGMHRWDFHCFRNFMSIARNVIFPGKFYNIVQFPKKDSTPYF